MPNAWVVRLEEDAARQQDELFAEAEWAASDPEELLAELRRLWIERGWKNPPQ